MSKLLNPLLAVLCLLWLAPEAYAWPAVAIPGESEWKAVELWQALRIVAPADREMAPAQAAELAASSDALVLDGPNRVLGRALLPYWALFSVKNSEARTQLGLLSLESTTQADVRLFRRIGTGPWQPLESSSEKAAGRIGGGTTYPTWALELGPTESTDLLLRVQGPSITRFPLVIYSPLGYTESQQKLHVVFGFAVGSVIFILVFIGSLRRYLEDISVPLFIGMLTGDLLGALWLSGFFNELFPAASNTALAAIGFAGYAILYGCGCLHARIYLETNKWAARTDRLLLACGWLWLALAPWLYLVFPVLARIILVWGGAAAALTLVAISFLAARQQVRFSGYILAAWFTYLAVGLSFLVARIVDNPGFWAAGPLALMQATTIAILFGLAMNKRLVSQRNDLVTARLEAEAQERVTAELMRERGMLLAATNHDLRQPLLGVRLFADLLRSDPSQSKRDEYWSKLDLALREVDETLLGIQQLATTHDESHQPEMEVVELDELLGPLVEEYRNQSAAKCLTIRYVPSCLSVTTHAPYLKRIVRNALSNALRYTNHGGRILVGCRRGGKLRLIIADNGQGMSEEQAKKAFDAFQRFAPKMADGFGLGLYSTKRLAHALGIEIKLHSHPGRGTELRIYLDQSGSLPQEAIQPT